MSYFLYYRLNIKIINDISICARHLNFFGHVLRTWVASKLALFEYITLPPTKKKKKKEFVFVLPAIRSIMCLD
jgi:hypothetical protein